MNDTGKNCSNCFFGVPINATRCKCHVSRPTANSGFPNVLATDYCGYWIDPKTMDRPFFYPIPSATQMPNTLPALQKGGAE